MPLIDLSEVDNSAQYWENSRSRVSFFITKLWLIVNDPCTSDIVHWNEDGLSFKICDQQRFCSEILPRYFKHNNMNSFIRQLNMYGFRKISFSQNSMPTETEDFAHPCFMRGQESYISFIKRRTPEYRYGLSTICCKIDELYNFYESLKLNHDIFRSEVDALKRSKVALLAAIKDLREKHLHQEQIIQKLISFIVTLLPRCSEVNMKRNSQLMIDGPPLSPRESKRLRQETNGVEINEILDDNLSLQHQKAPLALDDVKASNRSSPSENGKHFSQNSLSLYMQNSLLNFNGQNTVDSTAAKSPPETASQNVPAKAEQLQQPFKCIAIKDLACLVKQMPTTLTNNLNGGSAPETLPPTSVGLNSSESNERDSPGNTNFVHSDGYPYVTCNKIVVASPVLNGHSSSNHQEISLPPDKTENTSLSENIFCSDNVLSHDPEALSNSLDFFDSIPVDVCTNENNKQKENQSNDIFSWGVIDWTNDSFDK